MTDLATIVAAAAATLSAAQDAQVEANDLHVTAKEDNKAFVASVAEAKGNVKKAKEYLAALPADATDEQKATGQESLDGWAAELLKREAAVVASKALITSSKAALVAADKALKEAKKASDKANKPAKEAKVKAEAVVQNGMKYPSEGTISKTLWDIFDAATATKGSPAAITDVFETAKAAGVVDASVKAGYAHWRKFHGITGRVTGADHAAKEAQKIADKAAKDAKKAEDKAAKDAAKAQVKAEKDAVAAASKAATEAAAAAAAEAAKAAPAQA